MNLLKFIPDKYVKQIEEAAIEQYKESCNAKNTINYDPNAFFDLTNTNMEVVSIDRMYVNTKNECTVVGYWIKSDKLGIIHEYCLRCTRSNHDTMVSNLTYIQSSVRADKLANPAKKVGKKQLLTDAKKE